MAGEIKTSLHSSGRFRHAFTEQAKSEFVPEGDRAWFKWRAPDEFVPGAQHLLEIVVPTEDLTTPPEEPAESEKAKTTLFDPPPPPDATIISMIVTAPGRPVDGFPRPEGGVPACLLAEWSLPDGRRLWIVGSHQALDAGMDKLIAEGRTHLEDSHPQDDSGDVYMRSVVYLFDKASGMARYLDLKG